MGRLQDFRKRDRSIQKKLDRMNSWENLTWGSALVAPVMIFIGFYVHKTFGVSKNIVEPVCGVLGLVFMKLTERIDTHFLMLSSFFIFLSALLSLVCSIFLSEFSLVSEDRFLSVSMPVFIILSLGIAYQIVYKSKKETRQ